MFGAVLFKILGLEVTAKTLLKFGAIIGVALMLYLAVGRIKDHFDHIAQIEQQNETLKTAITRVEGQRDQAVEANEQNLQSQQAEREIQVNNQQIAAAEREAAKARTQTYKEIRDAIQSSPETEPSDSPIIRGVLDSLWRSGATGAGDQGRDP